MVGLRSAAPHQSVENSVQNIEVCEEHFVAHHGHAMVPVANWNAYCREIIITDSKAPHQTVACDIPWAALIDLCGAKHLKQYTVVRPNGSKHLRLHALYCEPQGISYVVERMTKAYACHSQGTLPGDFYDDMKWSLANLCCVQRALAVFGLHELSKSLHTAITDFVLSYRVPIIDLEETLEALPERSEWPELLLHYISYQLQEMYKLTHDESHCFCGWEYQTDTSMHNECLHNWVTNNQELQQALARRNKTVTSKKSSTSFGERYCEPTTKHRIEDWVLQVEPPPAFALGEFPHPRELAVRNQKIPTYKTFDPTATTYTLEWSNYLGGCYMSTYPVNRLHGVKLQRVKSTELSREWLASRGIRGGAGSPSELDDAEQEDEHESDADEDDERWDFPQTFAYAFAQGEGPDIWDLFERDWERDRHLTEEQLLVRDWEHLVETDGMVDMHTFGPLSPEGIQRAREDPDVQLSLRRAKRMRDIFAKRKQVRTWMERLLEKEEKRGQKGLAKLRKTAELWSRLQAAILTAAAQSFVSRLRIRSAGRVPPTLLGVVRLVGRDERWFVSQMNRVRALASPTSGPSGRIAVVGRIGGWPESEVDESEEELEREQRELLASVLDNGDANGGYAGGDYQRDDEDETFGEGDE